MKKIVLLCLFVLPLSFGCATMDSPSSVVIGGGNEIQGDRFGEELLARSLSKNLKMPEYQNYPVIVTTFVDLNDFEKSSVFGRLMAEKLLHQMNKQGFNVVEIRRAQDLLIKKEVGEMILTRDVEEIANITKARSVLAGTYVATTTALIINARLVDIQTPHIISSFSYEIAITEEIENLLSGEPPF